VPRPVKTRPYRSPRRQAQAAATRTAVLGAARALFTERGYAATTVAAVAERAGVAVDTVYAAVGRKPQLLIALVDEALAGRGRTTPAAEPTTAEQRDYVLAVREAATADEKLATYATALARLQADVVPLVAALRQAGASDPAARDAWQALGERRSRNMLLLAADLRATGELRDDLDDRQVADVLWTTNAPEYLELLAARGLDAAGIERLLHDLWSRVLLRRSS
jgi:AcrR family transcriptional regulator